MDSALVLSAIAAGQLRRVWSAPGRRGGRGAGSAPGHYRYSIGMGERDRDRDGLPIRHEVPADLIPTNLTWARRAGESYETAVIS